MTQPAGTTPPTNDGPADTRFARVFAVSPVPLALIGEDGRIIEVNRALCELLHHEPGAMRGRPMLEFTDPADVPAARRAAGLVADGDEESVTIRKHMRTAQNEPVPVRVTLMLLQEPGGERHRMAQVEPVPRATTDEESLRRQAEQDPLTSLGNRRALDSHLRSVCGEPGQDGVGQDGAGVVTARWSVLFVDLNDFKAVNDVHGHRTGDEVLVAVGRRLSRMTREGDLVVRLGGDEFVVLLSTDTPPAVERAADRVRRSLAQPIHVPGAVVRLTASVGTAIPQQGESPEQLLDRADQEMYRDKRGSTARGA